MNQMHVQVMLPDMLSYQVQYAELYLTKFSINAGRGKKKKERKELSAEFRRTNFLLRVVFVRQKMSSQPFCF